MSLTLGTGPFAKPLRGALNFDLGAAPKHVLYLHELDQRIRGTLGGETVVDTWRARLLHETGLLPQWYLPLADVRPDSLVPSDTTTYCPYKGDASYYSLRVGDRLVEDAVWHYRDPLPGAPPLGDLVAFYLDRVDAWYEEDERLLGHPRDPFHRVDTRASSRHVVVQVAGQTVADTTRPVGVFETGLPVRWYLPPDDIEEKYLEATTSESICPYKGRADYCSVRVGGTLVEDAAWCYAEPLREAEQVENYLSFFPERVSITVDGEPCDR
ncbi:MAG: DUF427 domain-containing protein [Actinomycetota bacterium]|nr:DUF427 domain-containing protein [Actinomycetota bacterium]